MSFKRILLLFICLFALGTGLIAGCGSTNTAPQPIKTPVIHGEAIYQPCKHFCVAVNDSLNASTGLWRGSNLTFTYQWEDCNNVGAGCLNISGATASSYTITSSDIGYTIRVSVTASNVYGSSTAISAPTSVVILNGGPCLQIPGTAGDGHEQPLPTNNYPIFAALDACGFPSPNTAGPHGTLTDVGSAMLPPNVTWNPSTNELSVNGAATVSNISCTDCYIAINTNATVVFNNDSITCAGCASSGSPIFNTQGNSGVTITNTLVTEGGGGSNCTAPTLGSDVGGGGTIVLDKDVFYCASVLVNGGSVTLTNSYLLTDGYNTGDHVENIYQPGGGGNDIEHNTLFEPLDASAVIFMDVKQGAATTTKVKNNLIAGGGYGDGAIYGGGPAVTVTNNVFSGVYDGGVNNAGDVCTDTIWTGNKADGTGAAVPNPGGNTDGC